ncbi:T-complex protein 11-domain-containing protein [Myxozyma melibiosi]|uniref:T-complex protein 11-domain-containing protein n=1 Tax=Myxozyma melibiosi TaxID=54550 RepID=A0ABR1FAA1_9ASCO
MDSRQHSHASPQQQQQQPQQPPQQPVVQHAVAVHPHPNPRRRSSLLAAAAAAAATDCPAMNYQTCDLEPAAAAAAAAAASAAAATTTPPSTTASSTTTSSSSSSSAAASTADDRTDNKRSYTVPGSVAKRLKLDQDVVVAPASQASAASVVSLPTVVPISVSTPASPTPSPAPSPSLSPSPSLRECHSHSEISVAPAQQQQQKEQKEPLPPTAYRRMRSKSLPDISLLTLAPSAIDDWAPKKRRHQHRHHHRSHRHHHHKHSSSSKRLIDSLRAPFPPSSSTSSSTSTTTTSTAPTLSPPALANVPPVNVQGLRELDLQEIFKNPQLRHDIVFDPQLQFRPNLDGERGRHKKALADQYWLGVAHECDALVAAYSTRSRGSDSPVVIDAGSKLVGIMSSLRDILLSLLPLRDCPQIEQVLDLELQLQQLRHGAFDFVKLAQWLAGIFKSHCAPMRDAWVDQMLACIVDGAATNDSSKLAEGLRLVFTILEAMKLDVANHQIRTLRPLLVETAVEFEQDYFAQRVALRKVDVRQAVDWYKRVYESFDSKPSYIDAFVSGLVGFFSSSAASAVSGSSNEFPVTFALDVSRLRSLKSDIGQISCLLQCLTLYRQLLASCQPGATPSQQDIDRLKSELLILVADDIETTSPTSSSAATAAAAVASNTRWPANAESIALQIARRVKERFPSKGPSLNAIIGIATRWLNANLASGPDEKSYSTVYKLVEKRVLEDVEKRVRACFMGAAAIKTCSTASTEEDKDKAKSQAAKDVAPELTILAGRICLLGDFHWSVFAGYYISGVSHE